MLTTSQRKNVEQSVRKEFGTKKKYFSEGYLSSKDICVIDGVEYYALLYAKFSDEESIMDLPEGGVSPLLIEKALVSKLLIESEQFRESDKLTEIAFMTPVDNGEGGAEAHDLVLSQYGPWDFLKMFFVSLFK